ncbi:MAG: hypothetical protein ACFFDP_02060 [Promethearchaeota archaeon]
MSSPIQFSAGFFAFDSQQGILVAKQETPVISAVTARMSRISTKEGAG